MRRTIVFCTVVALALLMFVPAASAGKATHIKFEIDYSYDAAEGELCDFDYREVGWGWFNIITVGTGPTMEVDAGGSIFVSHENLDTGYVLVEKVAYTDVLFFERDRVVEAGLTWHLRDANGKLVIVKAGLVTYDLDFNVLTFTPNRSGTFAEINCTALGGAPA